jgi:hypothetical protein
MIMKKLFYIFALVVFTLTSCEKNELNNNLQINNISVSNNAENGNHTLRPIILGEQKENPFSLENMKIALDTLKKIVNESDQTALKAKAVDEIELKTTDLYVRFLPQDSTQYMALKSDTTLTLFDFPLDYEIKQSGDYYHDPMLTAPFTWYYTTVKPGYIPPTGIKYEVLQELFIAENSEYYSEELLSGPESVRQATKRVNSESIDLNIFNALYAISFKLTGNEKELKQDTTTTSVKLPTSGKSSIMKVTIPNCTRYTIKVGWWYVSWTSCDPYYYPDGNIKVNTPNGDVGLKGVKVRMWRWFTSAETITDAFGNYYCNERFNSLWIGNQINYSIVFVGQNKSNSWDLERTLFNYLALWDVKYNIGYNDPSGVYFTFDRNNDSWGRCILNNAIYDFCDFAPTEGLSLPPNRLIIASTGVEKTWKESFSAPLLTNIYTWQLGLIELYASGYITPVGVALLRTMYPDLVLSYPKAPFKAEDWSNEDDVKNYNYTISSTWHELIHTAQFKRFEQEKGFWAASNYFFTYGTTIISHYSNGDDNVYGIKGDNNWQTMALSEGWAYFCEWLLARKYLNFDAYYLKTYDWEKKYRPINYKRDYPRNYARMYDELNLIGCSFINMEKSLAAVNFDDFRINLIKYYPQKTTQISDIVNKYNYSKYEDLK